MTQAPCNSSASRRHIGHLKRRIEYLKTRIKARQDEQKAHSYESAEVLALEWALDILDPQIPAEPEAIKTLAEKLNGKRVG